MGTVYTVVTSEYFLTLGENSHVDKPDTLRECFDKKIYDVGSLSQSIFTFSTYRAAKEFATISIEKYIENFNELVELDAPSYYEEDLMDIYEFECESLCNYHFKFLYYDKLFFNLYIKDNEVIEEEINTPKKEKYFWKLGKGKYMVIQNEYIKVSYKKDISKKLTVHSLTIDKGKFILNDTSTINEPIVINSAKELLEGILEGKAIIQMMLKDYVENTI